MSDYRQYIKYNICRQSKNRFLQLWFFATFALCLITANFGLNMLSLANSLWFNLHQRDSESLVLGRLVENKMVNKDSFRGFLGQHANSSITSKKDLVDAQYRFYEDLSTYTSNNQYNVYLHQLGGQVVLLQTADGLIMSALQVAKDKNFARPKFLDKVNENKIVLLQLVVAAFNAVVISMLLLWFAFEFDLSLAWVLLLITLASPWLSVFGRNLYWIIGLWFLPMVLAAWVLKYFGNKKSDTFIGLIAKNILFASCMVVSIFIKSTMGYEYLSTIVLAMLSVVLYYGIRYDWSMLRVAFTMLVGGLGSVIGFASCILVHYYKLVLYFDGSSERALNQIAHMIHKRTSGDITSLGGNDVANISGNTIVIILKYTFSIWNLFPPYIMFLAPFFWVSRIVIWGNIKFPQKIRALGIVTLFSMSAPISWFILARGHSVFHYHINYVLWHLPTMFFGCALIVEYIKYYYTFAVIISRRHS
jgi:hypothetical protein